MSFSFRPLINMPTRNTESTSTLIDNIFKNNFNDAHISGICYTDISDHILVFFILSSRAPAKDENKLTTFGKVTPSGQVTFKNDIVNIEWLDVLQANNPDIVNIKWLDVLQANNPDIVNIEWLDVLQANNPDIVNIEWLDVLQANNPDIAYDLFITKIKTLYERCFPLSTVKIKCKTKHKPWMTQALIISCKRKN